MSDIKKKEKALLFTICQEEKVPFKLIDALLRESESFAYEKTTDSARAKQYSALVNHHFNKRNE